jgi:hypothetical protein
MKNFFVDQTIFVWVSLIELMAKDIETILSDWRHQYTN